LHARRGGGGRPGRGLLQVLAGADEERVAFFAVGEAGRLAQQVNGALGGTCRIWTVTLLGAAAPVMTTLTPASRASDCSRPAASA
jgi:hypothetical protein